MIGIIDYGMGNLGAIHNMFKKIGAESVISSAPEELSLAHKLILPGVGAFDEGMKNLEARGLAAMLRKRVIAERIPVLGICLGMQLFTKQSEEGSVPGLGWLDARTVRFRFSEDAVWKVPHMGWNTVSPVKKSALFESMPDVFRFYFVHSYHVVCSNENSVLAKTAHGCEFISAVESENIYGVQFHPEKSHTFGMQLLKNFARCG